MAKGKRYLWIIVVAVIVVALVVSRMAERISKGSVLVLEVGGVIAEERPADPVGQLLGAKVTLLHNLLDAIDTARTDKRIAGLVVKVESAEMGWAKAQEIRGRLLEFRKSGKPSICHLSGDIIDNRQYYVATACDQVWIVPTAPLGVTGMMAQSTFLRGTLDKLKIYPDLYHIAEYKTAKNFYTEKKYTPAHREAAESVLKSTYAQYVAGAAEARKMDRAQFEVLTKQGPFLGQEALAHKLVDRAAYWDEIQEFFKQKNKEWKPVTLRRYVREVKNEGMDEIAIVHATGGIIVGHSGYDPLQGFIMGSDSVAADLRRAREDHAVKAVILRVDSPGGSAVGSEIIRREVQQTRAKKPVVVSMSDVAGSGGYWISMSAEKIFADPATITASIGVVFGKPNVSGFYDLLGLSTDHVVTSENATLMWPQQNFTPAQREAVLKVMQDIYKNFLEGVAAGRKMKVEEVDKIAKGRVWTGAQAKELRLVDEVAGFDRALAVARELAKIEPKKKVKLVRYPVEVPLWKRVLEAGDVRAVGAGTLAAELRRLANAVEPAQARIPFELTIR